MVERVVPIELGVTWEPNAPDAALSVADYGPARLVLDAHFDDTDQSQVVLVFSRVLAARYGPYNDEGLHHHRLYDAGLAGLLWAGEVLDSAWIAEVVPAVAVTAIEAKHHFIIVTKEALVEVLADGLHVERQPPG
jgi:hypothetical protein